uniref:Uncharacterized protein n=1 Tax=Anopheles culicifacies TaxID=139723 RepID=A0A182MMP1_9DIPT
MSLVQGGAAGAPQGAILAAAAPYFQPPAVPQDVQPDRPIGYGAFGVVCCVISQRTPESIGSTGVDRSTPEWMELRSRSEYSGVDRSNRSRSEYSGVDGAPESIGVLRSRSRFSKRGVGGDS